MSDWSPEVYERFKAERRQPFDDLLALVVPRPQMRVVDLGCGTGELTAELHQRLAAAETRGVDNSAAMLAKSAAFDRPGLQFVNDDIGTFTSNAPHDLVFSNAALHWVEDHPTLFRRLTAMVAPEGQLAVQMPANQDHPSHTAIAQLATKPPYAEHLAGYTGHRNVLPPEAYASLLYELGFNKPLVRLQVYGHLLNASTDVVEWTKGTTLTAFAERLPSDLFDRFVVAYRERLLQTLGDRRPYFFTFKRILVWGRKSTVEAAR
jgi:trans-aconitate 2-methyltransferase